MGTVLTIRSAFPETGLMLGENKSPERHDRYRKAVVLRGPIGHTNVIIPMIRMTAVVLIQLLKCMPFSTM